MKEKYFASLLAFLLLTVVLAGNVTVVQSQASSPPLLPGARIAPSAVVVDAATTASLTWAKGQAYPLVNGKATPPPDAPPRSAASGPPTTTYGGHWWQGSDYSGTSGLTTWVLAEISVPSVNSPDSTEFYYVLLSIWDNTGSYDQVGFADNYGVWGLAYSYTTGPCTSSTYHYSADVQSLTKGQEYLLAITTIQGSGYMYEEVYTVSTSGTISLTWSLGVKNGVANPGLEKAAAYCGYYDYTDYEEVYGTTSYTQPDPYGAPGGLEFYFHYNCYGSTGCNSWTTWTAWWSTTATPSLNEYAAPPTQEPQATIGTYSGYAELVFIHNIETLNGYGTG